MIDQALALPDLSKRRARTFKIDNSVPTRQK